MEKTANYKFPLHVYIASLFIGLIVLMAIVLGWFNYQQNSRVLLTATEQLYSQIASELGLGLQSTYRPIVGMVDVLADSDIMAATSLEEYFTKATEGEGIELFQEQRQITPEFSQWLLGWKQGVEAFWVEIVGKI